MFNPDVKVSKRVILKSTSIMNHWNQLQLNKGEQHLIIDKIIEVG